MVAFRIDVDGWFECMNVDGFLDAAFDPVVVRSESYLRKWWLLYVVTCMLEHCVFVFSEGVGGGICIFVKSSCSYVLGFAYVGARTWCKVSSCTRYMMNVAYCFALT